MPRDVKVAWLGENGEVFAPKGRMVWPALLKPKAMRDQPESTPKFGFVHLLTADSNIDALKKIAAEAAASKFGPKWAEKKLRSPFGKTIDIPQLKDMAAAYPNYIRPSTWPDSPPYIFGPDAKRFNGAESEIYGGRWVIPTVTAWCYDKAGNRGVTFVLRRVQLLDHDEVIGSSRIETASGFEPATVAGKTADAVWSDDSGPKAAGELNDAVGF